MGIAVGPRTWFGDNYGANVSSSGTVLNNILTGAFGYGIAVSSAFNFTVQSNVLVGNTSFIGSRGPNCSASEPMPPCEPFIVAMTNVTSSSIQSNFQSVSDADGLTCVQPPDHGGLLLSAVKVKRKDSRNFDTEGTNEYREAVKTARMFPAVFVGLLQHPLLCLIQRLRQLLENPPQIPLR
jgi:hypothetical protein